MRHSVSPPIFCTLHIAAVIVKVSERLSGLNIYQQTYISPTRVAPTVQVPRTSERQFKMIIEMVFDHIILHIQKVKKKSLIVIQKNESIDVAFPKRQSTSLPQSKCVESNIHRIFPHRKSHSCILPHKGWHGYILNYRIFGLYIYSRERGKSST